MPPARHLVQIALGALVAVTAATAERLGTERLDGAGTQAALDVPVRAGIRVHAPDAAQRCDLWRTVEEVARFAGVRVGFEHTTACPPNGRERRAYGASIPLDGLTPRMVFDEIVQARPDYAWREVDGVAVMRPLSAWNDPANVLHTPVAPVVVARTPPHLVLHHVLQAARPSLFLAHDENGPLSSLGRRNDDPSATGLIDVPISVTFSGGALLGALNAAARPFGGHWEVGYAGHPVVSVYTPDFDDGSTEIPLPARLRQH